MANIKTEGSHERNDTVTIEKLDGGQFQTKDAFMESTYLHVPQANWSFRPPTGRKIPLLDFVRQGQPPTQAGLDYYADEEPVDPLKDPWAVHGIFKSQYNKAWNGTDHQTIKDREQKRTANIIFGLFAFVIVVAAVLVNSKACGPEVHIIEQQATQQALEVQQGQQQP